MTTTAATSVPPELDAGALARWRDGGGKLIELFEAARELGPVAGFRLGERRIVLVTGAEQVQHVLAKNPDTYVKHGHRAKVLLGDGLLCASGEPWKRQRKVLHPQFTGRGIRAYEPQIRAAVAGIAERWAAAAATGEAREIDADLRHFSLEVIWRSLTAHPLDPETHQRLIAAGDSLAAIPAFAPATGEIADDFREANERADVAAAHAIALAGEAEEPHLLAVLLKAAAELPDYTERLVRDELLTLVVAGYETTATALSWLFLLLDAHPEQRDWALAAGPVGSPERAAAIRALVDETLRLYPVAWLMPRYAAAADTLDGLAVEAGMTVLLCPYLTHRDAELWPDPEEFRPQRFLEAGRRPVPGAYFPFGLGPRACVGAQFAVREMVLLLEELLPAYRAEIRETPEEVGYAITVHPAGPVRAVLHPQGE
ncbi:MULTISPECIES: cytochrome P450 [Kitasatospora]|uniref:Putative cytochrome P450 n=1 Tax=Kitasatospora setae (strain ATCC 33774 / DSM 43861 / JCM 3304 / KCC A-0304 / NBRC 14216 / KM-6054) TaxID=452652 RepID=E4N6Y0_KITSK|nr:MULTISPECIES: cytochrome P450 [Kitasatospora]BAJ26961.1 putative cytochrome P450 [Kitasatospora setae KM-6054]